MSENEPSATNFEYREMSSIQKYYQDIHAMVDTEDKALMAIVRLADEVLGVPAVNLSLLLDSEYMPSDWLIENDLREAKEMLAVLPFCYIAPLIEQSDLPIKEVSAWYHQAIRGARLVMGADHSLLCATSENGLYYDNCEKSAICPFRVIESQLIKGIWLPDFKDEMHKKNPSRMHAINMGKLALGEESQMLGKERANNLRSQYDLQYKGWTQSQAGWRTTTDPV